MLVDNSFNIKQLLVYFKSNLGIMILSNTETQIINLYNKVGQKIKVPTKLLKSKFRFQVSSYISKSLFETLQHFGTECKENFR